MRRLIAATWSLMLLAGWMAGTSLAQTSVDADTSHSGNYMTAAWQMGRGQGPGGYWQTGMQGDYRQTCQNIRTSGTHLQARCRKRDGGWRDTSIDYRSCRGEIINDDGNLRCGAGGGQYGQGGWWQGGMPQGNYRQTCQNVGVNGNMLRARCQKRDGGWRDTSLDYRTCQNRDVINDDGNLRCGTGSGWQQGRGYGGGWHGGMPRGDYQQSCQNVNMSGNMLQARCQKKDGGWRDSSIDYRSCRGDIINDDGHLRCR